MGIHLTLEKLKVFAFGAVLAGISGVYYSYLIRYLETSYFSLMGLSLFLIMVSGGTGSVYGPVLGSVLMTLLPQLFGGAFSQNMNLVFGVILVLIVLLAPRGLHGLWVRFAGRGGSGLNLRDYLFSKIAPKKADDR
jgi:branched-chain amino acid transport system permease protein